MKSKWLLIPAILAVVALACNTPMAGVSQLEPTLPPNLTMTALFGSGILGSLTPQPTEPGPTATATLEPSSTLTNTPVPTDTPVPPTATSGPTSTVTPPPTLTGAPATATSSAKRPGALVSATYLSSPPVLDGDWSEWTSAEYPAASVVYGAKNWSGADDLASSFRIGWDLSYLYLAVKVKDDRYVQNASGADLYLGDSLEVLLDSNLYGDFYVDSLNNDDYQLGISPGNPDVNGDREAFLWFPRSVAGGRSQVAIAASQFDGGYRVEVSIPWSVFGITPARGARYGFCFSVSDNDNSASNVQQTMVSSCSGRHLTIPTTWGELVLK